MLLDKTSKKINLLSFILFIGVMFIHSNNLEVYGIRSDGFDLLITVENTLSDISNSCVPCFFFISGFLFFRNFQISMLLDKYKSRIGTIVIPYIVWNTLYYFLFAVILKIPILVNIINNNQTVLPSVSGYIQYIYEGYYVFWFLRVLIWMILWTPFWYFLLKRRKSFLAEIALIILLLISLGKTPLPQNVVNVYYILGAYIGMNFCDLANRGNRKISVFAAICFPVVVFLSKNYAGQFLYNCCFFVVIWLALDLFTYRHETKWWMKCTFYYYCGHDMILEAIEKVILIIGGKSYFMAAVDYIMAPVLTLLILMGGGMVLRKWMSPVWRVLNGGR